MCALEPVTRFPHSPQPGPEPSKNEAAYPRRHRNPLVSGFGLRIPISLAEPLLDCTVVENVSIHYPPTPTPTSLGFLGLWFFTILTESCPGICFSNASDKHNELTLLGSRQEREVGSKWDTGEPYREQMSGSQCFPILGKNEQRQGAVSGIQRLCGRGWGRMGCGGCCFIELGNFHIAICRAPGSDTLALILWGSTL